MDPITWCLIGGAAILTGVTTYYVTRNASTHDDEHVKEQIANQIIIAQERDSSHEFAQFVILALILIILIVGICYWCMRCTTKSMARQLNQQNNRQNQITNV